MGMLKDIWNYRGFILGSVKREFVLRHTNSMLGFLWSLLNPISMIVVYTVIFSELMRAKLPGYAGKYEYSIYLASGMMAWNFFSEIITRLQNIFIENSNLIKKIKVPKTCFIVIGVLSASINYIIFYGLLFIFCIISQHVLLARLFWIFPCTIILAFIGASLGTILGVLNVFFRDVSHTMSIILAFWFWLTPIVYSVNVLSAYGYDLVYFNPITGIISLYQYMYGVANTPVISQFISTGLFALISMVIAIYIFTKNETDMVDEL